jgi:signal transduction histidine kinase
MFSAISQSIRYKMLVVVLATNLIVLIVTGTAFLAYELRNYRAMWVSELVTQGDIMSRATAPALEFDDPKSANAYLALFEAHPRITDAAVYNAKGKLFARYKSKDAGIAELPSLPEAEGVRVEGSEIVVFRRIAENNEILGTVYLRAQLQFLEHLAGVLGILAAMMLVSVLAALLKLGWLRNVVIRPIVAVTEVARQVMTRRDYSQRVTKTTEDEIGYLVEAFNEMLAEVGHRVEVTQAAQRELEHEVAERVRAEDELRRLNLELEQRVTDRTAQLAGVNKELEAFSYSVSHDLRAPLRAIAGFANLLIEDHGEDLNKEARRKLEVIVGESHRMGSLIDDLLAFSRLGRKVMQAVELDMTELVRSVHEALVQQHQGMPVEFRLGALPRGNGDRVLLGQVWTNLLSNAFKFSSRREQPLVEVNAISDEKEHIYFVRDNGAGFDPRYQSKLFEVFQRLHDSSEFPGTGVGLALVRRIVSRHGGRVWAEGRPDAGATFYFTLPKEQSDERV